MTTVKAGDTVQLHYTGRLTDGSVFDSSEGKDPLEFQAGQGMLVPGLDREIVGMAVGEKKTVDVPFADGYGVSDPANIHTVPRSSIPADIPLEIGGHLQMQGPNGQTIMVHISALTEEDVTLDANHFLAGKDMQFDVELVGLTPA